MSRHRLIRSLDPNEEYESVKDYEDDQFLFDSSGDPGFESSRPDDLLLSDFIDSSLVLTEEEDVIDVSPKSNAEVVSTKRLPDVSQGKYRPDNEGSSRRNTSATSCNPSKHKDSAEAELSTIQSGLTSTIPSDSLSEPSALEESFQSSSGSRSKSRLKEALQAYHSRISCEKPIVNLIVIGHVDAGKSTLIGHLLVALGYVSSRTLRQCRKDVKTSEDSVMYAWLMDANEEERRRGITMSLSQRCFETDKRKVVVLDAPGHKDFISNVITGVAEANAAILVLDASFGEFETGFETSGQTKEHVHLARSLGVAQLIVVVNKMDLVQWRENRYQEIVKRIQPFLKAVAFQMVHFIPCSGITGGNVLTPAVGAQWYSGPTLVDIINQLEPPEISLEKPFRMFISDFDKETSKSVKVTGKVISGYIKVADKVTAMPGSHSVTIKNISCAEEPVEYGFSGDNIDVDLKGIDCNDLGAGHVLCCFANPVPLCSVFQAKLVIFNIQIPITQGYSVVFHYQSLNEQAVITKIISLLHRASGDVLQKKPRFLKKNSCAIVEISVARPVCLELYSDTKELGRFLLRSGDVSIAAGVVVKLMK